MSDGHVTIAGKKVVRCPNPDCDPEEGCCVCEHTGWIYEYVLDSMMVKEKNAGFQSVESHGFAAYGRVKASKA